MKHPLFTINPVDPLSSDALSLLHAAAREIRPLYGASLEPLPANEAGAPGSIYLLAYLDGTPIGSIALRPLEGDTAEVRRMFVLPEYRRQRIARALLRRLEAEAAEIGYRGLRLETGDRQPAAITFYESSGYERIQAFGPYADDPTSICFEKKFSRQAGKTGPDVI